MLEDMTKVFDRMNELQKRFTTNRNYSFNVEKQTTDKNFAETLNDANIK